MTTLIVVNTQEIEADAPVHLHVHLVMMLEVSAADARHLASQHIATWDIANVLTQDPELTIREQQVTWRVPVKLSLPGQRDSLQVGVIEVDARTGKVLNILELQGVEQLVNTLLTGTAQTRTSNQGATQASNAPIYRVHEYAIDTGISDLAHQHDHYLYGQDKHDE